MQKKNIDKIKDLNKNERGLVRDYLDLIEDMVIDDVIESVKKPTYLFGERVYLKAIRGIANLNMLKAIYDNTNGYENKVIEDAIDKIYKHREKE